VWQALSGAQATIVSTPFVNTLYAILLAIAQHVVYLALNFGAAVYVFRLPLPEAIATGIMASQKSAPVAVTVITNLQVSAAQQGLLAVPCICGQIFQIFIGSLLLAPVCAAKVKRREAAAAGGRGNSVGENGEKKAGDDEGAHVDGDAAENGLGGLGAVCTKGEERCASGSVGGEHT
jgi:sodium/bile acid cotransporter 7